MRMMLGRVVLIGAFVGAVGMVIAQGPIGPFSNVRMRSDSNGALSAASAGACGTLGPLTPGANVPVRSDSSGALQICGTFGGGTPGGSDTEVQYNDGGSFGGALALRYNDTNRNVTVHDSTAVTGDTKFIVRSGAGQTNGAAIEFHSSAGSRVAGLACDSANNCAFSNAANSGGADIAVGTLTATSYLQSTRASAEAISMAGANAFFGIDTNSGYIKWGASGDAGMDRPAAGIIAANNGTQNGAGAFRSNAYLITAGAATGVTVNDAGTLRKMAYKVTVDRTAFVCAAVTCDVTIGTLPAKSRLLSVIADITQTFACTATCTSSTLSMTLGSSAGGTNFLLSFDADAATAQFGDADAELGAGISRANAVQAGFIGSWSSTTPISLRLTSGTGNIGNGAATNLSQGSVSFIVTVEILS